MIFKSKLVKRVDASKLDKALHTLYWDFRSKVTQNALTLETLNLQRHNCQAVYDKNNIYMILQFESKELHFSSDSSKAYCVVKASFHHNYEKRGVFDIFKLEFGPNGAQRDCEIIKGEWYLKSLI